MQQAERRLQHAASFPDNQLGDVEIYGPTAAAGEPQPSLSVGAGLEKQGTHSKGDLRKWMVPGSVWHAGEVDELSKAKQRIEAEIQSSQSSSGGLHPPSPDDVRAALTRATTLDLTKAAVATPAENHLQGTCSRQDTPQQVPRSALPVALTPPPVPDVKPGHVSVVMTLAGIEQHVWVPMTAGSARAAGLMLSSEAGKPKPEPVTVVSGNSAVERASSEPGDANDGEASEVDEETAAKALKNAYMRFYRSLQRNLAKVLVSKRPGKSCPSEIVDRYKEIKAKGALG